MPDPVPPATDRQSRLVEATIELLLEGGLRAVTTRAVTQRAGVGTGLLNHYFRWPELRALAWAQIFEAVARDQFAQADDPEAALERYFATAFTPDARRFWHLWLEATELAASDDFMQAAFRKASAQARTGLADLLAAGAAQGVWRLADPQATALRLGALYDGLAGLLLSPAQILDADQAEAHLRKAFALECEAPTG
ncbi:TetR/AcrR family transcriptional regulator [Pararhodobacter marinus]|uniref:TetR family transcriptional regulator n=1 Tax=Pararhodobacter marinus TaxID=2184063 RepID=A0A2U2CFT8_9RHOB|nr:TetR family transcriptional regulator C-terminal domain-containing protein [Pararhodobacter marinus]PWE30763.1 TetR family transcriptional regulator [Pararhodobacter marinus]